MDFQYLDKAVSIMLGLIVFFGPLAVWKSIDLAVLAVRWFNG